MLNYQMIKIAALFYLSLQTKQFENEKKIITSNTESKHLHIVLSSVHCAFGSSLLHINIFGNTTNKGNNKITELRTILQRESQNS